jgi:hypothetical protein
MCCNSNLYYVFEVLYIFMQFIFSISFATHEIVKFEIIKLTRRDKANIVGINVTMT